jgi:CheY-like chemotaxis protein
MIRNGDFYLAHEDYPLAAKCAGLLFSWNDHWKPISEVKSSTETNDEPQTGEDDTCAGQGKEYRAASDLTRRTRVFLVEDEAIIALDIRKRLNRLGHNVVYVASSAYEAIQQIRLLQPDIVLMDIRLQGKMDGIEAARIIGKTCPVPIIFMTAQTDVATRNRAEALEPAGYLVKPIVIEELNDLIISRICQDG